MESVRGVQNNVLNDVDDAVFGDGGFGFDLHGEAAEEGGVEEGLGWGLGHGD